MKLLVGLGNPGKKYDKTRHNAGFMVLDALAKKQNVAWSQDKKHQAEFATFRFNDEQILLAKPQGFMNLSGAATQMLADYYHIDPTIDLLVIHDEMDLEPGRLAFKDGGGIAGHNGLASIVERLGDQKFARLRIGIGRPTPPIAAEDWVLGRMEPATEEILSDAVEATESWITDGLAKSMNQWNRKSL